MLCIIICFRNLYSVSLIHNDTSIHQQYVHHDFLLLQPVYWTVNTFRYFHSSTVCVLVIKLCSPTCRLYYKYIPRSCMLIIIFVSATCIHFCKYIRYLYFVSGIRGVCLFLTFVRFRPQARQLYSEPLSAPD